jgi:transcriptional antiterminator RfaH
VLRFVDNPATLFPRVSSLLEFTGDWWVGHTKARFEKAFAFELIRRRIPYFLPMLERTYTSGGRRRRVLIPVFTSYVFFNGGEFERHQAMCTGRLAQVIPVVDQARLSKELSALERALAASGDKLMPHPRLAAGDHCRVTTGPFRGIECIVIGQSNPARVVLEVGILGQGVAMEIDRSLLEPLPVKSLVAGA